MCAFRVLFFPAHLYLWMFLLRSPFTVDLTTRCPQVSVSRSAKHRPTSLVFLRFVQGVLSLVDLTPQSRWPSFQTGVSPRMRLAPGSCPRRSLSAA